MTVIQIPVGNNRTQKDNKGHTYSMSSMKFIEKICKTDKENHLNCLILPLSEKKVAKFFKLITLLSPQITKSDMQQKHFMKHYSPFGTRLA